MDYEELVKRKNAYDAKRWGHRYTLAYKHYKQHKRWIKVYVEEFNKNIMEEIMGKEFKLRKQYSKSYQVVELEVEGTLEEYDMLADWLDTKMTLEMSNIPQDLLEGKTYSQPPKKQEVTKRNYTKNRQSYAKGKPKGGFGSSDYDKDFGSSKQWAVIKKNEERLEDEQGLTPYDIEDENHLKQVIGALFNN